MSDPPSSPFNILDEPYWYSRDATFQSSSNSGPSATPSGTARPHREQYIVSGPHSTPEDLESQIASFQGPPVIESRMPRPSCDQCYYSGNSLNCTAHIDRSGHIIPCSRCRSLSLNCTRPCAVSSAPVPTPAWVVFDAVENAPGQCLGVFGDLNSALNVAREREREYTSQTYGNGWRVWHVRLRQAVYGDREYWLARQYDDGEVRTGLVFIRGPVPCYAREDDSVPNGSNMERRRRGLMN